MVKNASVSNFAKLLCMLKAIKEQTEQKQAWMDGKKHVTLSATAFRWVWYDRWDADTSSLICDELGVGYPVKDGMPNLRPADGHVIEARDKESSTSQQPWGDTDASPK